jgi:hypothetical protein
LVVFPEISQISQIATRSMTACARKKGQRDLVALGGG